MNELGKRKVEHGALADLCFRPGATVVLVDDHLHSGQANAGAFKFIDPVQPLKDPKEPFGKIRIKPDTVFGTGSVIWSILAVERCSPEVLPRWRCWRIDNCATRVYRFLEIEM
jgi:hypothetical protein